MSQGIGANRGEFTPPQQLCRFFYPPRRQNYHAKLFRATRHNVPSCAKSSERKKSISSWAEKSEKAKNGNFWRFLAIFDLQTFFTTTEKKKMKN